MKKLLTVLFAWILHISLVGQVPVMTMTTGKHMGETFTIFSFILQANADNTQIQVDFGDGTLVNKTIDTSGTTIIDTLVGYHTISIYGTGITHLICNYELIYFLDVTQNVALTYLDCYGTRISVLDVSRNKALTYLDCSYTKLGNLDLTQNTALTNLICNQSGLTALDVTMDTALQILRCSRNQFTALNITNNKALIELDCSFNKLSTLDVTKNTGLSMLNCSNNQLITLDVTMDTALQILRCSRNQFTALNVTNNEALIELDCSFNKLSTLDVTKNTGLTTLNCSNNQLITLDVTMHTALQILRCSMNQFTALNVTNNKALIELDCSFNQLSTLDVTKNTGLTTLNCSNNQLITLDKKTTIAFLDISNNKLTFATISTGNDHVIYVYAPQKEISIVNDLSPGTEIDLSSQPKVIWVYTTVYTWKNKKGTTLSKGIDYIIENGKTIFLKAQADSVYCEITNAYFPLLVLKTTYSKVSGHDISEITITASNPVGLTISFSLAASADSTQIHVDFGDNALINHTIGTSPTTISGTLVGYQTVKIYGLGITFIKCNDNQINDLKVNQDSTLQYLDCSYNQLATLDITYNTALKTLICPNNLLSTLDVTKNIALTKLSCENNLLTFSSLPLDQAIRYSYKYAPQKPILINKDLTTGDLLDLTSQFMVNGDTTTYTWKRQGGTSLVQGTDYTFADGETVFLKAQADSVYCEMTNSAFPDFSGSNVLKTTNTMISSSTAIEDMSVSILRLYTYDKTLYISSPYNARLSVFDLNGRLVVCMPIYKGINKRQLPNRGFYLVKLTSNRDVVVRKVLVE